MSKMQVELLAKDLNAQGGVFCPSAKADMKIWNSHPKVYLELAHNWADWEATKRSYELMARYVHPHFQRASNSLRQWSYDDATAKHETAGAESKAAVLGEIEKYEQATGKKMGSAR